jgi:hypothetical protein
LTTPTAASSGFSLDYEDGVLYTASFGSVCNFSRYQDATSSPTGFVVNMGSGACEEILAAGNTMGAGGLAAEAAAWLANGNVSVNVFNGSSFTLDGSNPVGKADIGAFVVMNDGLGLFRLVRSLNGAVLATVIDSAAVPSPDVALVTTSGVTNGRTWDAVSDGPDYNSYGFVYWSATPSPGFWFQRYCQ